MSWLSDLFGGGTDMGDISDIYQNYLNQAQQALLEAQKTGRTDIQQYLSQALGYEAPYRAAGQAALGTYEASLGLPGAPGTPQTALDRFRTSPGYQFALQQGLQAAQRGAAARGLTGSGAEAQALQQAGQGLAEQQYGQYQSRLAQLAGAGQQAAGQAAQMAYGTGGTLAGLGLQYGTSLANLYGQMGQAQAEAALAQEAQQRGLLGSIFGGLGTLGGLFLGRM